MNPRVFVLLVATALLATHCRKAPEPLPVLGGVPAFSLRDHEGRPFSERNLAGNVSAVAFMFTRCPSVCPAVSRAMRSVQVAASRDNVPLRLVSVSVDPENDTPAVLKSYAKQYDADLARWTFVTGDYQVIQRTAEQGFKIAVSGSPNPKQEHFGITHGSHLVLVDPKLGIRGYYRTSEPEALDRLVADAARLAEGE